jgi:hypothetical protein
MALRKFRHEDHELKVDLGYMERSSLKINK